MMYKWAKVKENTLKECDINKLTGVWNAIYTKIQSNSCLTINLKKVGEHTLELQNIIDGNVDQTYNLEQSYDTLQGKLDRVIDLGDYQLGFPFWILHTDYEDCLVVYQVLKLDEPQDQNASEDIWMVFSRSKTISDENLMKAKELLLKSGAKIDGSDEILYKVNHENCQQI